MPDDTERSPDSDLTRLRRAVGARARRRARRAREGGVWSSIGVMGLVGWSIAVPTLLGAALGVWMDRRWPGDFSWRLALLLAGVIVGCVNAWRWIRSEGAP